jgi:collagenase-like PrtC family protease
MKLVCPAGSLAMLQAAIEAGADAVYAGFDDRTNARAFPGLNFDTAELARGVAIAHAAGREVYLALNTYPTQDHLAAWCAAVDRAADVGVDAVICADPGVLEHAARRHPQVARHLSVQGSATSHLALRWYRERFGIVRAVLPRVLSLAQIARLCAHAVVPLEVFGFGSLCIMAEGRCHLSGYVTGESPNTEGVCSPARFVRWEEAPDGRRSAWLNGVLIDRFEPQEAAGYPTVCKGRYAVAGDVHHALEEPTSLNTLTLLPQLQAMGIAAVKIEGRQRGPAYVSSVTRVWRAALDRCVAGAADFQLDAGWQEELARRSEGHQTTFGAYHRSWR